jgi:hypothetical protein
MQEQSLLNLLSKSKNLSPKSLVGGLNKFYTHPAKLTFDLAMAPQASYNTMRKYQADILPEYREYDQDVSYEMLGEMAQQRQQLFAAMAKKVRDAGGSNADVHAAFKILRKDPKLPNPGDYIRGAGITTPKMGAAIPSRLNLQQPSR